MHARIDHQFEIAAGKIGLHATHHGDRRIGGRSHAADDLVARMALRTEGGEVLVETRLGAIKRLEHADRGAPALACRRRGRARRGRQRREPGIGAGRAGQRDQQPIHHAGQAGHDALRAAARPVRSRKKRDAVTTTATDTVPTPGARDEAPGDGGIDRERRRFSDCDLIRPSLFRNPAACLEYRDRVYQRTPKPRPEPLTIWQKLHISTQMIDFSTQ